MLTTFVIACGILLGCAVLLTSLRRSGKSILIPICEAPLGMPGAWIDEVKDEIVNDKPLPKPPPLLESLPRQFFQGSRPARVTPDGSFSRQQLQGPQLLPPATPDLQPTCQPLLRSVAKPALMTPPSGLRLQAPITPSKSDAVSPRSRQPHSKPRKSVFKCLENIESNPIIFAATRQLRYGFLCTKGPGSCLKQRNTVHFNDNPVATLKYYLVDDSPRRVALTAATDPDGDVIMLEGSEF